MPRSGARQFPIHAGDKRTKTLAVLHR